MYRHRRAVVMTMMIYALSYLLLSNMLVMPMSMMSLIKCSVSRSDHMYRFLTSMTAAAAAVAGGGELTAFWRAFSPAPAAGKPS